MLFDAHIPNKSLIFMLMGGKLNSEETRNVLLKELKLTSRSRFYYMDVSCPFNCRASKCNDREINHQSRWPLIGLFVCRHCK